MNFLRNPKSLVDRQSNIIKYAVVVSLTVITANLLLRRYLNYNLLSHMPFGHSASSTPVSESLFTDFEFDPVERFDLENIKYTWIVTALAMALIGLAIGC